MLPAYELCLGARHCPEGPKGIVQTSSPHKGLPADTTCYIGGGGILEASLWKRFGFLRALSREPTGTVLLKEMPSTPSPVMSQKASCIPFYPPVTHRDTN